MTTTITKTLIWDLDGTLIDSLGIFREVLIEILPKHNKKIPSSQMLTENYHGSLEDTLNNVLGDLGREELETILADFLKTQNGHYEVIEHHIFPDALKLAQRAHQAGISQILVTNRNHEGRLLASPRSIVERSALRGLIDTIICGDDVKHRKPKAEVVAPLVASGELLPATTLIIGDQFVDAELARNLNCKAVLVNRETDQIAHLDLIGHSWNSWVKIVRSLDEVRL